MTIIRKAPLSIDLNINQKKHLKNIKTQKIMQKHLTFYTKI